MADDAVVDVGEVNTGDPNRLNEFIAWGVNNYPADRYALVLWNHGQGWDDTDIFADERYKSFSRHASRRLPHALFQTAVRQALNKAKSIHELRAILIDDNAKDFLDNKEMKQVVANTEKLLGRNLDILGMDACLMSMIEVGYQIHESVDFTVGSEQVEPGEGWPYNLILAELARNPSMKPQALSMVIVDQYLASYTSDDEVTQAACMLSQAEALGQAIDALAKALTNSLGDMATRVNIMQARNQVQSYDVVDNIDLVDFCSLLANSAAGSQIADRCQGVIQAVKSYVMKQGFKGSSLKNSHGVAIYFPVSNPSPPYVSPLYAENLDFANETKWGDFLQAYNQAIHSHP